MVIKNAVAPSLVMVVVRCNGVVRVWIAPEAVVLLSCQETARCRCRHAPRCHEICPN